MTLTDRLLAILKDTRGPYRLRIGECNSHVLLFEQPYQPPKTVRIFECRNAHQSALDAATDLNARHSLASILRMIAEDERLVEKIAREMFELDPAFQDTEGKQLITWDHVPCNEVDPRKYWLKKSRAALSTILSILPEEK